MRSLWAKLGIAICSILLVFGLVGISIISYSWYNDTKETLTSHGITTAKETAATINDVFVQAQLAAQILRTTLSRDNVPFDQIKALIVNDTIAIHGTCPALVGIAVVYNHSKEEKENSHKGFYAHIDSLNASRINIVDFSPEDFHTHDWFITPILLHKSIWTTPYTSSYIRDTLVVAYAQPFYSLIDGQEVVAGVISIIVNVNSLGQYLKKISTPWEPEISEESDTFLMNQFGHILIHADNLPQTGVNTIFSLCDEGGYPKDRESAKAIFSNSSGSFTLEKAPLLEQSSNVYFADCVNNWKVGIAIPENWIARSIMPVGVHSIIWVLIGLAIVMVSIFLITRHITYPLVTLTQATEKIGVGNFNVPIPDGGGSLEISRLTASIKLMQLELEDYVEQVKQGVAAHERTQGELNVAMVIQRDILPKRLPPFSNCEHISIAAKLIPAKGIGGDLYDAFVINKEYMALIIGDVSDKGVAAALFMAITQTLQRSLAASHQNVHALVKTLNDALCTQNDAGMFVTYWIGFLHIPTGHLTYTNAGHNPPLLKRHSGELITISDRHGPALAVVEKRNYTSSELHLHPNDTLILYTDGVTEAQNKLQELYGFPRLLEQLEIAPSDADEEEIVSLIVADVAEFASGTEPADDITIMSIRYNAPEFVAKHLRMEARVSNLPRLLEFTELHIQQLTPSMKQANQLMIAIEEIFVNIAHYAYPVANGDVIINVHPNEAERSITLEFIDKGKTFNPLEQSDPDISLPAEKRPVGGLGIMLASKLADHVTYKREHDANILTIKKIFS